MKKEITRRNFLQKNAMMVAGLTIVPSSVLGKMAGQTAPSDKMNIAGIGVGGKGIVNLRNLKSENIVAICDVDWTLCAKIFEEYPNAKKFYDYREMYDKIGKEIDGVVIATPDHTHADFDEAGPLNEMIVAGVAAVRLQSLERTLLWDAPNMKFTNISADEKIKTGSEEVNAKAFAEELIKHTYHNGFKLIDMP